MMALALKMLVGHRAACLGVIFGIFLATLLISQQSAIFFGLLSRSYRLVTDIPLPNLWIADAATESDDKVREMPEGYLDVVRSVSGIEWAAPLNISHLPLVTDTAIFEIAELYGVDDLMLVGAPLQMIVGDTRDLRRQGGIIIDLYSANGILAKTLPDGSKEPLKVGSEVEINNRRAVVVGICKITPGFYPKPIVFTSQNSFHFFRPFETRKVAFIAAKTLPFADIEIIKKKMESYNLKMLTREQFKSEIVDSFLKTGILINFALTVGLGVIIGLSITGQVFYMVTLENSVYYALIRALGGTKKLIAKIVLFQAFVVGSIGFFLGVAATVLWGFAIQNTTLAFLFPWQLFLSTGVIILLICLLTALMSIRKVYRIDPKILMGS